MKIVFKSNRLVSGAGAQCTVQCLAQSGHFPPELLSQIREMIKLEVTNVTGISLTFQSISLSLL